MNTSRRSFLRQSAAVLAASLVPLHAEERDSLVGTQLYGWGQYDQREGKNLEAHLDDVLAAVRDAGYDYAEHSLRGRPEENVQLAERMKARGLRPVCLYTGGALHDAKAEAEVQRLLHAAEGAKAGGFRVINCNPNPIGREKTDAELDTQRHALELFGAGLNDLGLRLGVHNHTPEMKSGAREFHQNLRGTDAAKVGFCYDVHWVFRGGLLPQDVLPDYGARIVSWHFRQSRDKIWWEDLDAGDLDFAALADAVREHKLARVFSVELALEAGTKITRSCVENHARSRQFVKTVFGA